MAQRIKSRRRKAVKKQTVHYFDYSLLAIINISDVFWTGNAIQYQFLMKHERNTEMGCTS